MNRLMFGAAVGVATLVPAATVEAYSPSTPQRICVDQNWGPIDNTDPINVKGIQQAVGARADGVFGDRTCARTWEKLIALGKLSGNGKTLRIGNTVHDWLGVDYVPSASSSSNLENSSSAAECSYDALSEKETARLLGATGVSRKVLCENVFTFQRTNGLRADGDVGPITARNLIKNAKNPCGIYGNSIDDCFLGVQSVGNLGTLYTVKDGKIIDTMPSRFGNDKRAGGKKTPEGAFSIFRSKDGPHRGSNCKVGADGQREACMENPLYFNGGMAIHGTRNPQSIEGSLGCIGVSNPDSYETMASYKKGINTVVVVDFQRNNG